MTSLQPWHSAATRHAPWVRLLGPGRTGDSSTEERSQCLWPHCRLAGHAWAEDLQRAPQAGHHRLLLPLDMGNISSNISSFQSLHIVMLGLDSAGKTTVLYRLKFNEFVNTVPTIGFNTERIRLSNGAAKGISCHFWDVGGQEKLRPLWKSYSRCTDGIIYVVDSVDSDRLEEAKTELHKVTKFAENQGTPLLVIANKQDLPKSLAVAEIERQLALQELSPSTPYHIQPACAIIGEGLTEGMDKLYEMILKRRKTLKQKKKQR
ncbi:ADP-ribosylation factor-like protein 4C [Bufo gargarizans]|uniref:ADP-ribosylation factor-like protein 4C n=1 Tax=Bufo gargarizans TaxID=30331 RepID=UPI001CF3799B|nr:ADP-ribosylation factor-like protein 4C [Bufo gargarizans]